VDHDHDDDDEDHFYERNEEGRVDENNNVSNSSAPKPRRFRTFKSYCVTRWYSELSMIESFMRNKGKLYLIFS
jgi:hypothetical protein